MVDTNILVYSALPSAASPRTELLAQRDGYWAAPLLWRSEFRNVVAGCLRRGNLNARQALQAMTIAEDHLTAGQHSVADAIVFDLVKRSPCTAYDCEFVALAIALNVPLITEDRALLREFPGICRSLSQMLAD